MPLKMQTIKDSQGSVYEVCFELTGPIHRFVVVNDLERVAYANCTRIREDLNLDDLYVYNPYRGRKIGSGLLRIVIKYARQNGFTALTGKLAGVDLEKEFWLPNFYRIHGFAVTGEGQNVTIKLNW